MAIQRWWEETKHELFYHTARDEAYMRHHFREEVERNLRDIIRHQRAQMALQAEIARAQVEAFQEQVEAIERGLSELGRYVRDLSEAVSWSMEVVANAIESLGQTMSWGFAQVIWQQEQTNQLLQDILKKLSSPRTTEAEEMRERGNEFYMNGINSKRPEDRERWINLAIEAYLEAIRKNPADFSVFLNLGIIQFFEKGNSELALRSFHEAAALAEPYSPYHSALSWVHLGYVHRNRNEFEEAYQATAEAIRLQPDWAEAHYQHAVHCALTGRMDEMRAHLTKAIELDETYFPKAATDPDFLPFFDEVRKVLDTLLAQAKQRAQTLQSILTRCQKVISGLIGSQNEIYALLTSNLQNLQQAQDYVALRRAIPQAEDVFKQLTQKFINLTKYLPITTLGWHRITLKVKDIVYSIAFSPDEQFLASGGNDKTIKIWQISDGSLVKTLTGHTDLVHSVAFSPDGQFLASGSGDKTVKIWKVSDGSLVKTLTGHTDYVNSVIFSPNGQFLASGSWDRTIKIWKVSDGSLVKTLTGHTGSVFSVAFSPDGQFLASGGNDKTIKIWQISDGSLVKTLTGHTDLVHSVAFSPDGQFLASGSGDKTVKIWKVSDGSLVKTLTGHTDLVRSIIFSPNGQFLASGGKDKIIKIWLWYPPILKWTQKGILSETDISQFLNEIEQWQTKIEQMRIEEEQRRQMEALKARRRMEGLCEECGKPLGFWDKLLGRTKCPQCR